MATQPNSNSNMALIDLEKEAEENPPPAYVLGQLEACRVVRTPFTRTAPDGRERQIYLRTGDHVCSGESCGHEACPDDDCTHLIEPDEFGPNAPMLMLLGRQKMKYGRTYCEQCLQEVQ